MINTSKLPKKNLFEDDEEPQKPALVMINNGVAEEREEMSLKTFADYGLELAVV